MFSFDSAWVTSFLSGEGDLTWNSIYDSILTKAFCSRHITGLADDEQSYHSLLLRHFYVPSQELTVKDTYLVASFNAWSVQLKYVDREGRRHGSGQLHWPCEDICVRVVQQSVALSLEYGRVNSHRAQDD